MTIEIKTKSEWKKSEAWDAEFRNLNAESQTSAHGIIAALILGYAVRDNAGRARSVFEFSGYDYDSYLATHQSVDPVLHAFIRPEDGSLDRDALREAAKLLLDQRGRL